MKNTRYSITLIIFIFSVSAVTSPAFAADGKSITLVNAESTIEQGDNRPNCGESKYTVHRHHPSCGTNQIGVHECWKYWDGKSCQERCQLKSCRRP